MDYHYLSKNKSRNCCMKATKSSPSYESSSCSKIRLMHYTRGSSIVGHLPQWPMFHQKAIAPGKLVEWPRRVISPQISNENLYHELQTDNTTQQKETHTTTHPFIWFPITSDHLKQANIQSSLKIIIINFKLGGAWKSLKTTYYENDMTQTLLFCSRPQVSSTGGSPTWAR